MDRNFKIDFIGIGATKSGTTWLANCLRAHPEVCLSEPKEVQYFNLCQPHLNIVNKNHSKPFSWYVNHFRHCRADKVKGEFSPVYMHDEKAPYSIKSHFPEVKLIVCLRNPIDRAYSDYWMRRSFLKRENETFEHAIEKDKSYVEIGLYCKQLRRYFELFERNQILILLFDDIVSSPAQQMKKVFDFLGVNSCVRMPSNLLLRKQNEAKEVRYKSLMDFVTFAQNFAINRRLSFLSILLRKVGVKRLVMKIGTRPIKNPDMNPQTRMGLYKIFENDIKGLEKLVSRDLSHWK